MPQPDSENPLYVALAMAEECACLVSQALLKGEPAAIESAAHGLHKASLSLAGLLQPHLATTAMEHDFRGRLGKVARHMAMQREALLRRSAVVERSLHSLVPATRVTTYAGGAAPYGHKVRQSGAFKLLAA